MSDQERWIPFLVPPRLICGVWLSLYEKAVLLTAASFLVNVSGPRGMDRGFADIVPLK